MPYEAAHGAALEKYGVSRSDPERIRPAARFFRSREDAPRWRRKEVLHCGPRSADASRASAVHGSRLHWTGVLMPASRNEFADAIATIEGRR